MKTVLVTRAPHQAAEMVRLLIQHNLTPVLFPTIEIAPPESWTVCDQAIQSLYMYNGIIFTSANGVEFFFTRLKEHGISTSALSSKMICVVGEKTKAVVEQHGLEVTIMPEKFTSDDLFNALKQEDITGQCFLHPKGSLGNDTLSGNLKLLGAKVDTVIVYQTVQPKPHEIKPVKKQLLDEEIDVLTFASPSAIKNFILNFSTVELQEIVLQIPTAVIGPVTYQAAKNTGFQNIFMPEQASIEALAAIISKIN